MFPDLSREFLLELYNSEDRESADVYAIANLLSANPIQFGDYIVSMEKEIALQFADMLVKHGVTMSYRLGSDAEIDSKDVP